MINIKKYKNALFINGHANFAKRGSDIVCAGVSSIAIGALNWFDIDYANISVSSGDLKLIIDSNYKKGLELIDLIFTQLLAMYENYKDYINIKEIKDFYKE